MPPGSAMLSSRAAIFTPSPRMSSPSMRMSPRLIPIRNRIRRSSGRRHYARPSPPAQLPRIRPHPLLRETQQYAVAGGLDDAPAMLRDQRIGDGAVFAQDAGGAGLVEPHKSRITGHVGGQYRRQSASDPSWWAVAPWLVNLFARTLYDKTRCRAKSTQHWCTR